MTTTIVGPNKKIRCVKTACGLLDLPTTLLSHIVKFLDISQFSLTDSFILGEEIKALTTTCRTLKDVSYLELSKKRDMSIHALQSHKITKIPSWLSNISSLSLKAYNCGCKEIAFHNGHLILASFSKLKHLEISDELPLLDATCCPKSVTSLIVTTNRSNSVPPVSHYFPNLTHLKIRSANQEVVKLADGSSNIMTLSISYILKEINSSLFAHFASNLTDLSLLKCNLDAPLCYPFQKLKRLHFLHVATEEGYGRDWSCNSPMFTIHPDMKSTLTELILRSTGALESQTLLELLETQPIETLEIGPTPLPPCSIIQMRPTITSLTLHASGEWTGRSPGDDDVDVWGKWILSGDNPNLQHVSIDGAFIDIEAKYNVLATITPLLKASQVSDLKLRLDQMGWKGNSQPTDECWSQMHTSSCSLFLK